MKVRITADTSIKNKLDIVAVTDEADEIGFLRVQCENARYVIDRLFVGSVFRRQNVANRLLDYFLGHMAEEYILPVEAFYTVESNDDAFHRFMKQRDDFLIIPAGESFQFPASAVLSCELVAGYLGQIRAGLKKDHSCQLSQASDKTLSEICEKLTLNSLPSYTDIDEMRGDVDMELSFVYNGKSGAEGAILVRNTGECEVEISALYTEMMGYQAIELVSFAAQKIFDRDPFMEITLLAKNGISAKMAEKLGGNEAVRKEAYIADWLMSEHFMKEE